jgi:hypothetical protein
MVRTAKMTDGSLRAKLSKENKYTEAAVAMINGIDLSLSTPDGYFGFPLPK